MNFTTVSVADFRAKLQEYLKTKLPLLLARHSDVIAVVLEPAEYNRMVKRISDLEAHIKDSEAK